MGIAHRRASGQKDAAMIGPPWGIGSRAWRPCRRALVAVSASRGRLPVEQEKHAHVKTGVESGFRSENATFEKSESSFLFQLS
jgi:hypothetical protein